MTAFPEIASRVSANLAGLEDALAQFADTLSLSKEWVQREWLLSTNNVARPLLLGAKVTLLEAGTAWAIGSNRGAASSLRAYVENVFAWLYYKDHPVEFRVVEMGRGDLMLPKGVQGYFKQVDYGFERAYLELVKQSSRGKDDEYYYSAISQFVHAHPTFNRLSGKIHELAVSSPRDASFLKLCQKADEFISDNFAACYRGSWDDAPNVVKMNILDRLKAKTKDFLAVT